MEVGVRCVRLLSTAPAGEEVTGKIINSKNNIKNIYILGERVQ